MLEEAEREDDAPRIVDATLDDSFDASTFVARFSRNPNWWGGQTPLDSIELRGFADLSTAITAMQSRDIDVIQQFTVLAGGSLLDDGNFTVLTPPAATHRQVWFNTQQSQFSDKRLRQAIAYCLDRPQMVETLFAGRAEVANDHPVLSSLPFYDPDAVEQRGRVELFRRQAQSFAAIGDSFLQVRLDRRDRLAYA